MLKPDYSSKFYVIFYHSGKWGWRRKRKRKGFKGKRLRVSLKEVKRIALPPCPFSYQESLTLQFGPVPWFSLRKLHGNLWPSGPVYLTLACEPDFSTSLFNTGVGASLKCLNRKQKLPTLLFSLTSLKIGAKATIILLLPDLKILNSLVKGTLLLQVQAGPRAPGAFCKKGYRLSHPRVSALSTIAAA